MFTLSALAFSSVAILVQWYAREWAAQDARSWFQEMEQRPVSPIETFDFIVVGGGTAGCVVASRLSESGQFNVLLLEAGGDPPPQHYVPGYRVHFLSVPEVTFQYNGVPSEKFGGTYKDGIGLFAGKVLGGTSSINEGFFNRGNPLDYDNWARATGDATWKYENLVKYFKNMEDYKGDFPNPAQHGTQGRVTVSSQPYAPGLETWMEAGRELGYTTSVDPNGPQQEYVGVVEWSKLRGRRVEAYSAYLKHVEKERSNLKVLRYSTATEIVLENGRAVGVAYKRHGVPQFAKASKEVVVSAGAIGSPKLLLKSGVGPAEELNKLPGVTPRHNLPVGRNLLDHPLLRFRIYVNDSSLHFDPALNITEDTTREYLQSGSGPLAGEFAQVGQAFITTKIGEGEGQTGWPDIQVTFYAQDYSWSGAPDTNERKAGEVPILMHVYLGRPKSAGAVKLNPNDIEGPPLIQLHYFSHSQDMARYIEGIKKALAIFEDTTTYKRVGARYTAAPVSGCEGIEFRSDAYWECLVRQMTFSGCHLSGTCKMGQADNPTAVVDSKLRVIGLQGLRVADASIMPTIVNSNTQAACYMIGEKVAHDIIQEWRSAKGGQCQI